MRFDLFYEIALPPYLNRSEAAAYADVLSEIELADRLGFGCAWLVEHHFMRHYSHCAKPELVLAAASRRTASIRLGLAVIPLPLHHPVHVLERVATLDVLSGGRVEIGIGRGFSPAEFDAFGVSMEQSRTLVDESLDILRAGFSRRPVSYQGTHYRLQAVDILPHAAQSPHPPLWTAAVSPETFIWAARQQLGILAGPFKPWFMVKQDIAAYLDAWNHSASPRIGMTVGMLCLEDGRRARRLAGRALTWFYSELYKTTAPVLEKLYPSYERFHELGRFRKLLKLGISLPLLEASGMAVVGDPAHCIARLREYQHAGVTRLLCAVGAGAVETEIVRESLQCIAKHVMPAFQESQVKNQV